MSDFIIENGILRRYIGSDTAVTVPECVHEIGEKAFSVNVTVREILIPESVKWIASTAFYGCRSLVNAQLSEGVTAIGSRAFADCTSLRALTLPDSIGMIHMMAFLNCSSLATVRLPSDLRSLESCVFQNCTSLRRINVPYRTVRIERTAFYNCPALNEILISPQKLQLITGTDPHFSAYLRGCFAYSEQNSITEEESATLARYAKACVKALAPQLKDHLPTVKYTVEHKILTVTEAELMLKLCTSAECRSLILNYINSERKTATPDEKYELL